MLGLVSKCSVCFEDSGYLWNAFVCLGKNGDPDVECRKLEQWLVNSGAFVALLANNILGRGYRLFVDN